MRLRLCRAHVRADGQQACSACVVRSYPARARRRAGYGNSAPNNCWGPIMLVTVQTLVGIFLDAVVIGVIFARISHPKRAPPASPPSLPWPMLDGVFLDGVVNPPPPPPPLGSSKWHHLGAG